MRRQAGVVMAIVMASDTPIVDGRQNSSSITLGNSRLRGAFSYCVSAGNAIFRNSFAFYISIPADISSRAL